MSAEPPGSLAAPAAGGEIEVLYIEDSVSYAKLVERMLASRPRVRLEVAADGLSGLDRARRRPPSLILLDRHLPDVDGDEVLARLRSDPATAGVPVVMVTADDAPADIERLLAAGASGWLVKPFQLTTLLDIVEGKVWLRPRVPREAAEAATPEDALLDETVLADLRRLVDASPSVGLADLLAVFQNESRSRMNRLRTAVAAGDAAVIAALAHGLIGSSASFGARRVADGSRHLQRLAVAGDLTEAGTVFGRLESDFAQTSAALDRLDA